MKLSEVIRYVSQDVGLKQSTVKAVLDSYAKLIESTVNDGVDDCIPLSNAGRFKIKTNYSRTIYNPRTNEHLLVTRTRLHFSPSRKLRNALKQ